MVYQGFQCRNTVFAILDASYPSSGCRFDGRIDLAQSPEVSNAMCS